MSIYTISFDEWEAKVKISEDPETIELLKTQLLFFITEKKMQGSADDVIIDLYLHQIATPLISESMEWNKNGVISAFEKDYEGFLSIDGSMGVELLSCESWSFSCFNIEKTG